MSQNVPSEVLLRGDSSQAYALRTPLGLDGDLQGLGRLRSESAWICIGYEPCYWYWNLGPIDRLLQSYTIMHLQVTYNSRFNTFRYASFDVLWAYFSSQTNSKRHRPHPVMERSLRSKSSTKACHWHSSIVLGAMSRGSKKFKPFGWIWKFWKEFWKKTQFLQDSFTSLLWLLFSEAQTQTTVTIRYLFRSALEFEPNQTPSYRIEPKISQHIASPVPVKSGL